MTEATVNQTEGSEGRCKNYAGVITKIEEELCCVEGLDEKEAALPSGRSKGVVYCWKNLPVEATADNGRTTSVPRAWRHSAIWLRQLRKTFDARVAAAAKWKLIHYRPSQPDPAQATQQQLTAMVCFGAWQKPLTRGELCNKHWVGMLLPVADKQAPAEENAASTASVLEWTSSLFEGPANGLRRQHSHTRIATGWTQSADCIGEEHETGDRDDLDGLSHEQLQAFKLNGEEKRRASWSTERSQRPGKGVGATMALEVGKT